MLNRLRTIRVEHILYSGRWLLALLIPLLQIGDPHPVGPAIAFPAEGLLVFAAVLATCAVSKVGRPQTWWMLFVSLDVALISLLALRSPAYYSAMWVMYLWCVIEAALSMRSFFGLVCTFAIDALSLFVTIVPLQIYRDTLIGWAVDALLFNLAALPIVFLAYWAARRRRELEERVAELSAQIERTRELETINRQMADYAMDVQNRAVIDQLTGLFNQTYFHHRLLIEVEKARQAATPLSLILCDIDHFKRFNDQFGHYLGDDVLRSVAKTLLDAVEGSFWVAGRIGGEELAVLMPEAALAEAAAFAETLRRRIENTAVPGPNGSLHVTVSIGVAAFPDTAEDALQLTKQADRAMYAAKGGGRNRVFAREA